MVDSNREAALREAIELIFFSYRSFTRAPDLILQKRGLNRMHHRILYFVGREPAGSVNDLLKVLEISKQALHNPLRQLIAMNLVSSSKSRSDARVKELRLTSAGKKLEARLTGTQILQLAEVFDQAGPEAEKAWRKTSHFLAND